MRRKINWTPFLLTNPLVWFCVLKQRLNTEVLIVFYSPFCRSYHSDVWLCCYDYYKICWMVGWVISYLTLSLVIIWSSFSILCIWNSPYKFHLCIIFCNHHHMLPSDKHTHYIITAWKCCKKDDKWWKKSKLPQFQQFLLFHPLLVRRKNLYINFFSYLSNSMAK